MLEPFRLGVQVQPVAAKQDKIELRVGNWEVAGTSDNLDRFSELLGAPPADARPSDVLQYSELFNRPQYPWPYTSKYLISSGGRGSTRRAGAPLFAGALVVTGPGRYRGAHSNSSGRKQIHLDLSINPTRFVAHQVMPHPDRSPNDWAEPSLETRHLANAQFGEFPLDNNDNVIITSRRRFFGRPEWWPNHLGRYWRGVVGWIRAEINRAVSGSDVTVTHTERLTLKRVETYWEFSATDPIGLVRQLEPLLLPLGLEVRSRDYSTSFPDGYSEARVFGNSRTVTIILQQGIWLTVYAKTNRRVRFEVRHHLNESNNRRVSNEYESLFTWLENLAEDAARRLNEVLAIIRDQAGVRLATPRSYHLIHRIFRACPDIETGDLVLSLLINNGGIRIAANDPLHGVVHALVKCGVLLRLGRHRAPYRYGISPQFSHAIEELRD